MNAKLIDLAWTGSLYEPSSDQLFEKISDELKNYDTSSIVIFRLKADCHDYSNSWNRYLADDCTWIDLATRLHRWHLLMSQIASSDVKFFIVFCGDLIGSWWELALAMKGRISTNPYAKVGFPETFIDMFPPMGILCLKKFSGYDGYSSLKSSAILHTKDAYKKGLVDLCLLSDEWAEADGIAVLENWCRTHKQNSEVRVKFNEYKAVMPNLRQIEEVRGNAKSRREWLQLAQVDNGLQVARMRNLEQKAFRLTAIQAAAAMRFLMPEYSAWLSRRIARYRLGLHDRWWTGESERLTIDISRGLPPHEIVKTLLLRRKKISFIAENSEALRLGLETIRSKFNRSELESTDAIAMWGSSVTWYCNRVSIYDDPNCKFNDDGTVEFEFHGVEKKYLRLSGNLSSAGKGWYEDITNQKSTSAGEPSLQDELTEVVELISNGILSPKKQILVDVNSQPKVVPITTFVRLILLEYLVCYSKRLGKVKSFADMAKLLGSTGWGYASDIYNWEAILKASRWVLPQLTESMNGLFAKSENWEISNISSLVDYKVEGKNSATAAMSKGTGDVRSGAAISRNIETLACRCAFWLYNEGHCHSLEEADLFITLSWGYPGFLTLPHSLQDVHGNSRVEYWLKLAGLNPDFAGVHAKSFIEGGKLEV